MRALDAAIGPCCAGQVWAAAYRRWPPAADRDRWPGSRGEEQAKYFRPGTWRLPGPWASIPLPDLQPKEPMCAVIRSSRSRVDHLVGLYLYPRARSP